MIMMPSFRIEHQQHSSVQIVSSVPTGKRLVILGESQTGPYYEPIYTPNLLVAQEHFGAGKLIERYQDALLFDSSLDVYLMRIDPYGFVSALDVLKSYEFDLLYCDTVVFGIHEQEIQSFIEFAHEKEQQGILVHGIFDLMSFQTLQDLDVVEKQIQALTFDALFYVEEDGKYLSVVADQMEKHKAGAVYAGMVASLDIGETPLNKAIPVSLKQHFAKKELLYLEEIGVVSFRQSIKKGVVCATCPCAVRTPGAHKNIANFRIVQSVVLDINHALSSLIGQTGLVFKERQVQEYLLDILERYRQKKILREYAFGIVVSYLEGMIYVELELVPVFTVEKITTHTQIRVIR
jgi:hypothetical protein